MSFSTYEKEYQASIETITEKIAGWKRAKSSRLATEVDNELGLVWDTVDSMDKVARSTYGVDAAQRNKVSVKSAKLTNYRSKNTKRRWLS